MWVVYPFERLLFRCVLKTFNKFWFLIPFIISTYMCGIEGVTKNNFKNQNLSTEQTDP